MKKNVVLWIVPVLIFLGILYAVYIGGKENFDVARRAQKLAEGSSHSTLITTAPTTIRTYTTESGNTENCQNAILDITNVICSATNNKISIAVANMGQIELYDFVTFIKIENNFIQNHTGGPTTSNPLRPGEQTTLVYTCSSSTECTKNAKVELIRVTPVNCPTSFVEEIFDLNCI
jgi:archaellum component FlaF (FlaF/FlaG flagellin family)